MNNASTESLSFNRGDWSGRTETVEVDRTGQIFKVMGYTFKLVEIPEAAELGGRGYRVTSADGSWAEGHVFGTVWSDESPAVAISASGDLARDDEDIYVAAAKLLCNLI